MKLTIFIVVLLSGCTTLTPKPCYERTISLAMGTSKQVICTRIPQTETPNMKRISP